MATLRRRFDPALALFVVILAAHFIIIVTHYRHPLITDEVYYVAKARYIVEHHAFAPADPRALAVERGTAWGNSDWRPPGYALFLAAVSLGDFSDAAGELRLRTTIVHFLLVAGTLLALYRAAARVLTPRARWAAAILLAAPPWTFEFVNEIGPDPLIVPLAVGAIFCFARGAFAGGVFLLTLALFFRPEMIVLPPVMMVIAFLLRGRLAASGGADAAGPGGGTPAFLAAVLIYIALVGVAVAYRTWFTGRAGVFGGLHIYNRGLFDWANSWFGTEKEGYDFVYAVSEALPAPPLPSRAFDNAAERAEVSAIVGGVMKHGFSAEADAAFGQLARARNQRHPLRAVAIRLWHMTHLWLNVENNTPLLRALSSVPRNLRRPLYGFFLVLRVSALFLAMVATVRALKNPRDAVALLILLFIAFAAARSVLVAGVLNWKVHRLVLSSWPGVLWCASVALRRT